MKTKSVKLITSILLTALALTLGGCGQGGQPSGGSGNVTEAEQYSGEDDKLVDFSYGLSSLFSCSDGWSNGGMFDCVWKKTNVTVQNDGLLHLSVTGTANKKVAGEYRSWANYRYGYYSVKMKPVKRAGVISSFFIYNGWPWHEVDIEFLGKDTTKVQFNYFTDGVGGHEYLYELGFDASEELHEYAFKWEEGRLTWFVDGLSVYTATQNIPSVGGKLMVNCWTGKSEGENNVVDWAGRFDNVFPVPDAEYAWIGYKGL